MKSESQTIYATRDQKQQQQHQQHQQQQQQPQRLEENGREKEPAYEPHDHGNTHQPINYWGAVVHLTRSTIGTGILLLPFAFKSVGYGIGIVGTLLIGLLYINNLHALLFSEYELCKKLKKRNLTFVGVVEKSFEYGPKWSRKFGPFFKSLLYLYYGIPSGSAIYLIIIADNSKNIFYNFFGSHLALSQCITVVLLPITLLCLIPKLKFLVPLSIVTNVFTAVNIAIILLYSLDLDTWKRNGQLVGNLRMIPKFFAVVLQSLIATGMILPLKNDMRDPKAFGRPFGVLNVSFSALTLLFCTFGVVGYLNYGADVKDNVLSNLPAGNAVTVAVYILYTLALCVTYTLLFYVYYDTVWTNILSPLVAKTSYAKASQYALRVFVNLSAYVMAIAVPNFSLFTSIVGTIGIIIEIGLPSVVQLLVLSTVNVERSAFIFGCFKNSVIIVTAVIMFCMSLKTCTLEVIELYAAADPAAATASAAI